MANYSNPANDASDRSEPPQSVSSTQASSSARTPRRAKKHKTQATKLRFVKIHGRPDVARVQLLLSNISDRPLFFKLKSNVGSNVSALPSGSGHVAARGSTRCVITWHRARSVRTWEEVEPPKLLLVTRFLDGNNQLTNDQTCTRLMAHVASKGSCSANNPPVEQFLLDAVSRNQENDSATEVSIQRSTGVEEKPRNALVDMIVDLTPEQLSLLILLIMFVFLALYNSCVKD